MEIHGDRPVPTTYNIATVGAFAAHTLDFNTSWMGVPQEPIAMQQLHQLSVLVVEARQLDARLRLSRSMHGKRGRLLYFIVMIVDASCSLQGYMAKKLLTKYTASTA
jgi:16S rRNA C967 or C1407 C5-methylase (RsmB/RsmF family)